jgi:hypothetical protein
MIRACRTDALGLKDAGFNSLRRKRAPGYSTECGNYNSRQQSDRFKISYEQSQRRSVAVRMRADIADRMPGERFRPCCRFRQFHFPNCVQARRRTCLDGGSVAVGAQHSGCAGGQCNSVPFDLSSTDLSAGYRAPIAACSSNQVTRIAKMLDARSRSKRQRGRKLFTLRVRIFLTP